MNSTTRSLVSLMISVIGLSGVTPVHGQTLPNETLASVIEQALSQHASIALAGLDRDAAAARLDSARAAERPRLDLTISNDVNKLYDPFTGTTATVVINGQPVSVDVTRSTPRSVLLARLRLSYPLYTGGRLTAARKAATANLIAADAQVSQSEARIAKSVADAWFALHRANLQVSNTTTELALQKKRIKLLAVRVKRGRSARIDLETARSKASTLATQVAQFKATRRANWATLSFVRGEQSVLPEPDWAAYTNATRISQSISRLQRFASDESLNRQLGENVQTATQQVREARSAYKPNVSLFAQYNAAGRSRGTKWIPADQVRASDFTFGATIEWNLYAGGATDALVAEKASALNQRKLQRDESIRARQFAVASARQELQAVQLNLDGLNQQLPLANRKLELARVTVKAGRADGRQVVTRLLEKHALSANIRLAQLDLVAAHTKLLFANSLPATQ